MCAACSFRMALELDDAVVDVLGKVHGDYELLEEIGRGGAGVVFRARQRSLDRVVALKVLCAGPFADAASRERLLGEARAVARLNHPHIVAVYEAGEMDGQPYFTMEWVPGRTLADVTQTGPVPARRAALWMRKVAAAVAHAHAASVLHRDMKPSNILLDLQDEPRVADFGLAKVVDGAWAMANTMALCGSPAYMPPEQANAEPGTLAPAMDVYGIGAVLYELVTGRPPFFGSSVAAVLDQVREHEPLPPRALNPSVPLDLENIILKCLRKEPARRYVTAADLEQDLQNFLDGKPVRARSIRRWEKVWLWARRRPLSAGSLTAAALALLAMFVVWIVSDHQVRVARDAARERLAESLLDSVRVMRLAHEPGWREKALANISEARRNNTDEKLIPALRREAVAALAEVDYQWRKCKVPHVPQDATPEMLFCIDETFQKVALWNEIPRVVEVRSLTDGSALAHFPAPWPDEVCAFSPCSRYLSLRHGSAMSVWDTTTGKVVLDKSSGMGFRGFSSGSFAPKSARFARGEADGFVAVYELREGGANPIARWSLPSGKACGGMDWSLDESALLLIADGRYLSVCDAETGAFRWQQDFPESISQATWRNEADRICVLSGRGRLVILDGKNGHLLDHLTLPVDGTTTARFNPEGTLLAASGQAVGTRLWNAITFSPLARFDPVAWHLVFSADGRRLGSHYHQGEMFYLEQLPGLVGHTWTRPEPLPDLPSLAVNATGSKVITVDEQSPTIWNTATGSVIASIKIPHPRHVAAAKDGSGFFCADDKGVWSFSATGESLKKIHDRPASAILATPGKSLIVADQHQPVIHYLLPNRTSAYRLSEPAQVIATDANGRWIACSRKHADYLDLLDLSSPSPSPKRLHHAGARCSFSADGTRLLTCGRLPRLWRTSDLEPLDAPALPLAANNRIETLAAISPDGRWLAATQHDREVHLVEIATGKLLAVLPAYAQGIISDVAFSADGNTLVIASGRGDLRIWPITALRKKLAEFALDW